MSDDLVKQSIAELQDIVRAALMEVHERTKRMASWDEMPKHWRNACYDVAYLIRSIANDPAEVAAIIKKAEEDRG